MWRNCVRLKFCESRFGPSPLKGDAGHQPDWVFLLVKKPKWLPGSISRAVIGLWSIPCPFSFSTVRGRFRTPNGLMLLPVELSLDAKTFSKFLKSGPESTFEGDFGSGGNYGYWKIQFNKESLYKRIFWSTLEEKTLAFFKSFLSHTSRGGGTP